MTHENADLEFALRLADAAGVLTDPETAVSRMRTLLTVYGVDQ